MSASVALVLIVAACSDSGDEAVGTNTAVNDVPNTDDAPTLSDLPVRDGPRRETSGGVPHVQLGTDAVPAVDAELRRRALLLPGVEDRPSSRSLPGARGLWLTEDVDLAVPEALGGSREFAHFHPDGSLHLWLPVDRAAEVDRTKWGEIHPWADRDGFWDGVVMIYIPETPEDAEVALQIIVDAYNFVTGSNIATSAIE